MSGSIKSEAASRHGSREHFIPLRKAELVDRLAAEPGLSPADAAALRQVARLLEATFHFEFHERLESLKQLYATFDPDADTAITKLPPGDARDRQRDELFDATIELLQRANYRQLSHEELQQALAGMSDWGVQLDVNFEVFEKLAVFARGDGVSRRSRRRWRNLYRLEEVDVPVYQRLVVVFDLLDQACREANIDSETVYLKMFKDIPKMDVEMLLPGTRVRMSWLDRGKILLPTLSGVVMTAVKIIKGALAVAFASLYGLLAFLGLVGGTIGYGVKSFLSYLRAKDKYQLNLTRSLYYQNLDNNAGVLFRLLDEAEEQECREAVLAWFLLWQHAPAEGWTRAELDAAAEVWLRNVTGRDVDFEIDDALAKLERLGLVDTHGSRLTAVGAGVALERLDCAWDNYFDFSRPRAAA